MGSPLADALLNQQPMSGPIPLASMVGLGQQPTPADAWDYNRQAIGDYVTQQQQKSADMGLWDPAAGMPTKAGMMDAANQLSGGLLMGSTAPGIRAFHGSPHSFDQFSNSAIGTGEGAQAYGHGLYFADREATAQSYRDALRGNPVDIAFNGQKFDPMQRAEGMTPEQFNALQRFHEEKASSLDDALARWQGRMKFTDPGSYQRDILQSDIDTLGSMKDQVSVAPAGHMYEVNINADPAHFLDWDKPLSEQSQAVQDFARNADISGAKGPTKGALQAWREGRDVGLPATGQMLHRAIADYGNNGAAAAEQLKAAGIPGIRYLDGGSRGAGQGTQNHVVFDDNLISIIRKYGLAGLLAGGGAAAGSQ